MLILDKVISRAQIGSILFHRFIIRSEFGLTDINCKHRVIVRSTDQRECSSIIQAC